MNSSLSPIEYLQRVAHENHARFISGSEERAVYGVCPVNASGAPSPEYVLEISRTGNTVSAKELDPILLPRSCAERHINTDGTFCLYWGEMEPSEITNVDEAAIWWGKLLTFLLRQRSAAALRRWPGKADARAHGSEAARFQALAEKNASNLGPSFEKLLRDDSLRLGRGRRRDRVALVQDGRRVVTVLRTERRVMLQRQRCKCDLSGLRGLPLVSCGDHAREVAELVLNMESWRKAEADFYKYLRASKQTCCGTMDDCPLARASG